MRYSRTSTLVGILGVATINLITASCSDSMGGAAEVAEERPVEELDLYRVDGDRLYVYSRQGVLSVVDVSVPTAPRLIDALPVEGRAGELFTQDGNVVLVIEERTTQCEELVEWQNQSQQSEVASVMFRDNALELGQRYCLPGEVIGSRLVGNILYVVTHDWEQTWVVAFDATAADNLTVIDVIVLNEAAHEIHVTAETLFVAQETNTYSSEFQGWYPTTRLTYIDIKNPAGDMVQRGSITLAGAPQGKFHLDATDTHFRIVTFDSNMWASLLHVIDITEPDSLTLLGSSEPIGYGEQLYATRFVDDRAYVVTFRRTDPLWVIDLSDPTSPHIIGELMVPGWSDFIFPRGDQLITVGHGDGGTGVAVSAFNVAEPANPTLINRIEFGDWNTQSEANEDYRAAQIYEPGQLADTTHAVLAMPMSWEDYSGESVRCMSYVQMVELGEDGVTAKGGIDQSGAVRRTLAVNGELYSISDVGLLSVDARNLDELAVSAGLDFPGTENRGCEFYYMGDFGEFADGGMFFCSASNGHPGMALISAFALVAWMRRRRR